MEYRSPHILYESGDWVLENDTIDTMQQRRYHIASIRHTNCKQGPIRGATIWFNGPHGVTVCQCGAKVPDEIQGLCTLYNMEWLQQR